ncbi:hypothetical protein CLF_106840 [Clonorchis sinensis]|uniref:Uncharacterized protein n=1 Tax=Clonorchis sinensis TaxID=79923 RepID=G7YFU0_CLOSI|nr:hypothetical protein CLF_106840 [Clonorchis sinensis]
MPVNQRLTEDELSARKSLLKYGTLPCEVHQLLAKEFDKVLTIQDICDHHRKCRPVLLDSEDIQTYYKSSTNADIRVRLLHRTKQHAEPTLLRLTNEYQRFTSLKDYMAMRHDFHQQPTTSLRQTDVLYIPLIQAGYKQTTLRLHHLPWNRRLSAYNPKWFGFPQCLLTSYAGYNDFVLKQVSYADQVVGRGRPSQQVARKPSSEEPHKSHQKARTPMIVQLLWNARACFIRQRRISIYRYIVVFRVGTHCSLHHAKSSVLSFLRFVGLLFTKIGGASLVKNLASAWTNYECSNAAQTFWAGRKVFHMTDVVDNLEQYVHEVWSNVGVKNTVLRHNSRPVGSGFPLCKHFATDQRSLLGNSSTDLLEIKYGRLTMHSHYSSSPKHGISEVFRRRQWPRHVMNVRASCDYNSGVTTMTCMPKVPNGVRTTPQEQTQGVRGDEAIVRQKTQYRKDSPLLQMNCELAKHRKILARVKSTALCHNHFHICKPMSVMPFHPSKASYTSTVYASYYRTSRRACAKARHARFAKAYMTDRPIPMLPFIRTLYSLYLTRPTATAARFLDDSAFRAQRIRFISATIYVIWLPELPRGVRALMRTPSSCPISEASPEKYIHLGVANELRRVLPAGFNRIYHMTQIIRACMPVDFLRKGRENTPYKQ